MIGQLMSRKWSLFYFGLILVLLALNVKYFSADGHDFRIYTAAAEAYRQGLDPYLVKNIAKYSGTELSFAYPPLSLLCFNVAEHFNYIYFYITVWSAMLLASFFIMRASDSDPDPVFLAALVLTGFRAAYWNLATGNVDLTGMLFISVAYYFLKRDKGGASAAFISVSAFLKIFPIFYGLPFLLRGVSRNRRARTVIFWLLPFALLSLASYALFSDITPSYYMAVTGRIEGQHTPIAEGGGAVNPASIFFFRHLCLLLFHSKAAYPYLFFGYAVVVMVAAYLIIRKEEDDPVKALSVWIIAFMLVFPRLKPYSMAFLIPPVYFLSKDWGRQEKFLVLLAVSLFPLMDAIMPSRYWDYNELVGLFLFFIYYISRYRRARTV